MVRKKWSSVDELNQIDLSSLLTKIPDNDNFKHYFDLPAGIEHYRLLSWLSDKFSNIVEIGVFKGFSGLSFSKNSYTNVTGFDINNFITFVAILYSWHTN